MSFDVDLLADLGGPEPVYVTSLDANYTYNCSQMFFVATEEYLSDLNGRLCSEIIPIFETAIKDMTDNPEKYEALNPENGWGNAKGWLKFITQIYDACVSAPLARLDVH
jgi:hypothetical protein